jgi:dihydrodipicolinate synthase/N-acetylneuraminate lyase
MQAPVTPFLPDHAVDFPTLERLVDWHTATDRNIGIVALFNKAEPLGGVFI